MIVSNESSILLPEDLQRAIEAAKNSLTLIEQETFRLKNLARDQELNIKQSLVKLAALDEDIEKRNGELVQMESRVSALELDLAVKREELAALKESLKDHQGMLSSVAEIKERVAAILKEI